MKLPPDLRSCSSCSIVCGSFRMQVVNVILVNVSMMEIHSGNLEQSALNIKIVPAGFIISTKNLKFPGQS